MELGRAFGPIQMISDFIYLISAVISSDFGANRTRFHLCRTPRGYKIVISWALDVHQIYCTEVQGPYLIQTSRL